MKITYIYLLNLLYFIQSIITCLSLNAPKVRIDSGEISGGYEFTYNGRKLYSFLGIPYASPPIEKYRFKVIKIKLILKQNQN